jgi:hypothetical protein
MIVDLNHLIFETVEGSWHTEYIAEPNGLYDSDQVNYYIRFKWVDPNNPENKVTPERRLRLVTYYSQSTYSDYEEKLKNAIYMWLESTDEAEASYVHTSIMLQVPSR